MTLGVGLYGGNGHQVFRQVAQNPRVRLVAVAGTTKAPDAPLYGSLAELLADDGVDLVSLCSPRRADQAADAVRCMRAGKAVYAEKPAALTESDLDQIATVSAETGCAFREMAGTAFDQPYLAMREIVESGAIGDVLQVFAQKSYPWHDGRSDDDGVDGGILPWAGVHAFRFIEHVTGCQITDIDAVTSRVDGHVKAASTLMTLNNGAVASAVVNYLNPSGFPQWGNDHLRIFGTTGFVESVDGGTRTRLVVADEDLGPIDTSAPGVDHFDRFVAHLIDGDPMPLTLGEELHPTRVAIRAQVRSSADTIGMQNSTSSSTVPCASQMRRRSMTGNT